MSELTPNDRELGNQNQIDVEKLIAENQTLRASKERILEESKGYKNKFQESETILKQKETVELERQGEFEKLLQQAREEKADLVSKMGVLKQKTILGNIKGALSTSARDAADVDLLLRLPEADMITYDEDSLSVDQESIESMLTKVRADRSYLFQPKKMATQATGNPVGSESVGPTIIQNNADIKNAKTSDLLASLNFKS